MVHELPDELGMQVTALNFGAVPIAEQVLIAGAPPGPVCDMLTGEEEGALAADGHLLIRLEGYMGKSLLLGR